MLNINEKDRYKTFGYNFIKGPESCPAQLYSLGWQIQNTSSYCFDGLKRHDEQGNCIFQYTLSGSGILRYDNQDYILDHGTAFIAVIPSDHCYYLPVSSEKWEFLFITLTGQYSTSEFKKMLKQSGSVIRFNEQAEIIKYLWEIYWNAVNETIIDGFHSSVLAYEFIMKLLKSLNYQSYDSLTSYSWVDASIQFMKDRLLYPSGNAWGYDNSS